MPSQYSRPVKVLISGALASGGVQTHVTTLCESLSSHDVQFTLLGARTGWAPEALEVVRQRGVRIFAPNSIQGVLRRFQAAYGLFRVRRERFDVLLLLGSSTFHKHVLPCARPNGFAIYNEIMHSPNSSLIPLVSRMDGLIAISRFSESRLRELFPRIPVQRLAHFPSYSNRGVLKQAERVGAREIRLVYIGRLDEGKRPEWLINRWSEFAAAPPVAPARLDIFGTGDERLISRMKASILRLGLRQTITLHGGYQRTSLDDILSRADLVLNPSMYEGLGLVLLESMHRGVPVVATQAGGSADLGEDNPDCIFTEGNNWMAFCTGVREMAVRLRSGTVNNQRLHRWVEDHYNKETLLHRWRTTLLSPRDIFGISQG